MADKQESNVFSLNKSAKAWLYCVYSAGSPLILATDLFCTCGCLGESPFDVVEAICNSNIFNYVTGMDYIWIVNK